MKLFAYFVVLTSTKVNAFTDADAEVDLTHNGMESVETLPNGSAGTHCRTCDVTGDLAACVAVGTITECTDVDDVCGLSLTRDTTAAGTIIAVKSGCQHKTVSSDSNVVMAHII